MKEPHENETSEAQHFEQVLEQTGNTWWGNKTQVGQYRQEYRADILFKFFKANENKVILDLGCGIGEFSIKLASRCDSKVIGIDITEASINYASKHNQLENIEYITGSAYDIPLKAETVDLVAGNAVLHHFNLEKAMPEIKRVLKPGGLLIFFEPNMLNPQIYLEKNVRFIGKALQNSEDETAFYKKAIKTEIVSFGFSQVEVIPFDFMHPIVPGVFLGPLKMLNSVLEKTPFVKEISGSLIIKASKG